MNKLTKVGVSALCGSLAAVASANAGSLSVAGSADATWVGLDYGNVGNPIGLGSNMTFTGSGELDNGSTVTLNVVHTNTANYSSSNLTWDIPGLGKLGVNQLYNGIDRIDDKMPTAWEETWGTAVGTGINAPKNFDKFFCQNLSKITKNIYMPAHNKYETIAAHDSMVNLSGCLNTLATSILKISNDIAS